MRDKILIEKILKYSKKVISYTRATLYEDFTANTMMIEACVFNLSQIGELANKISEDCEKANDNIPWRMLYGLRNKIVHDYDGVNPILIWDIISNDLPALITQLEELYKSL